tara:strand:- start:148932 stop:149321 length:390 start_codon:yes stop_codon:yes gene_type:complete
VGKLLSWILLTPLVLGLILFAASNRADVVLRLWPFDYELTTPVALVGVGGLFLGFLWGAVMVWISGGVARGRARREAHRADGAEKEILRLKTDVEMLEEKLRAADAKAKAASLPVPASDTQGSGSRHIL